MKSLSQSDFDKMKSRFNFSQETLKIIEDEGLLPYGLVSRLHAVYPEPSTFSEHTPFMFSGKEQYSGLKGFREIVEILRNNQILISDLEERELFIRVYRFMATRHVLNMINWKNYQTDSLFLLVFPQPGMIDQKVVENYLKAVSPEEQIKIAEDYMHRTNPHDGKQKLNKPVFINSDGEVEIIEGSQHKYPPCQLIFDVQTQNCFSFCSYCFRHAQVRGDIDMFLQKDVSQVHRYLRTHKEVTDILITGGDAGFLSPERFEEYINPILSDPDLLHIKSIRLGTRMLTFHPELVLTKQFERMLSLFRKLYENGIQLVIMSHFSTPREILNITTLAAIRRLKASGATLKSQSPIMSHISLFKDEHHVTDVDRTAKNWIDLGNILAILGVGFHSMYCARPTGEHHYFTAPLAEINKVFNKVYRELPSINRPSRYITMTSSAGKISLLGTLEFNGKKYFALKFNEGRNMEWLDKVYLAQYDELETTIANLKPAEGDKHFYEEELQEIEQKLEDDIAATKASACHGEKF